MIPRSLHLRDSPKIQGDRSFYITPTTHSITTRTFNSRKKQNILSLRLYIYIYFFDFVAVEKGSICCSKRQYTLNKVCWLTESKRGIRSGKVAVVDISEQIISRKI